MIESAETAENQEKLALNDTLRLLTRMIEHAPQSPIHYLLRGEEWLAQGDFAAACADLDRARQLAQAQAQASAWGYLYQSYADRAIVGLRQCQARQRRGLRT